MALRDLNVKEAFFFLAEIVAKNTRNEKDEIFGRSEILRIHRL